VGEASSDDEEADGHVDDAGYSVEAGCGLGGKDGGEADGKADDEGNEIETAVGLG